MEIPEVLHKLSQTDANTTRFARKNRRAVQKYTDKPGSANKANTPSTMATRDVAESMSY